MLNFIFKAQQQRPVEEKSKNQWNINATEFVPTQVRKQSAPKVQTMEEALDEVNKGLLIKYKFIKIS